MKLNELLKEITPLPWTEDTAFPIQGKEFWVNQAYRRHAANVLPELVEACRHAECNCSVREIDSGHRSGCWFPAFQAALEKAENVQ